MKENKYDDPGFFGRYSKMERSVHGLVGAGEWYMLRRMLPDMMDKKALDLGCGFGWHCRYIMENGGASVVGVDISENMLARAREINTMPGIEYVRVPVEDARFEADSFDLVLSSLAFHYLPSFEDVACRVYGWLKPGGSFVFSVEHPVFTARGSQQWLCGHDGEKLCWPVDRYFEEGMREAEFLGEKVVKYHKTLTTYLNGLLTAGFRLKEIIEPQPDPDMLERNPEMNEELRRPMMLLVSAEK